MLCIPSVILRKLPWVTKIGFQVSGEENHDLPCIVKLFETILE